VSGTGEARARARAYLEAHHVVTLATVGPDGPWAAAVFYALHRQGFALTFLSSASTRHARNLASQPRVAASIQDDTADWRAVKGVQLEGAVRLLGGEEAARARALFGERFPVVGKLDGAPAAIVEALARVHWYELVPSRLLLIDNAAGFGNRVEVELG
jgi:uncharacterized protein YhbP (UPF0306 family)